MPEYIERNPKCEDCIHQDVCFAQYGTYVERWVEIDGCKRYKSKADVAEVRHGVWVKLPFGMRICSECRYLQGKKKRFEKRNYCPNCGAKMDGKGADNDRN